jgi:hypothetical protein
VASLWQATALPANIRLGWKRMAVANALAYYHMATIVAVKSFIVQAHRLSPLIEAPHYWLLALKHKIFFVNFPLE